MDCHRCRRGACRSDVLGCDGPHSRKSAVFFQNILQISDTLHSDLSSQFCKTLCQVFGSQLAFVLYTPLHARYRHHLFRFAHWRFFHSTEFGQRLPL